MVLSLVDHKYEAHTINWVQLAINCESNLQILATPSCQCLLNVVLKQKLMRFYSNHMNMHLI